MSRIIWALLGVVVLGVAGEGALVLAAVVTDATVPALQRGIVLVAGGAAVLAATLMGISFILDLDP